VPALRPLSAGRERRRTGGPFDPLAKPRRFPQTTDRPGLPRWKAFRSKGNAGTFARIEAGANSREKALLTILIAAGEKAIEAFQASANPVDVHFLADLERIIERSRQELGALQQGSNPS
jgi:hypothetical protein